jgi:hypothetical protein
LPTAARRRLVRPFGARLRPKKSSSLGIEWFGRKADPLRILRDGIVADILGMPR